MSDTEPSPEPVKPTKEQFLENIRVSALWRDTIKRSKFYGDDAVAVAGMIGFFEDQNRKSTAEYEAAALVHPEWSPKPPEPPVVEIKAQVTP